MPQLIFIDVLNILVNFMKVIDESCSRGVDFITKVAVEIYYGVLAENVTIEVIQGFCFEITTFVFAIQQFFVKFS